jgi:molecular chaperone DnaK
MAVVGIDLGTTNTVVACAKSGRVQVLADDQGRTLLPSVVSFHPNGDVLVGHAARERRVVDAKNTIASVKRLIGRAWDSDEIKKSRPRFAFELREGVGQGPLVAVRDQTYTLPEISAFVLRRAKQIADAALGEPVDRAVITVPASFNELQRAATKVAGRIAGLDVMRIINEPTAATLAYGFGRRAKERVAVYDFGGGTFDCTLLELSGNVFEVLASAGDSFLGGDDLDLAIADRMADSFLLKHRWDPRAHPQVFERLRVTAEAIKVELSTSDRARAHLRDVAGGVGGTQLDLEFEMTRLDLDALAAPLVERTFAVCEDSLRVAGLSVSNFDKVILVGGSTRIALVRERVEQFFGAPPLDRVSPDEVVAIGAAIQAAALADAARRRSIPPPPTPAIRALAPPPDEDEVTISSPTSQAIASLQQSLAAATKPPTSGVPPPLPRAARPAQTTLPMLLGISEAGSREVAAASTARRAARPEANDIGSATPVLVDVTPRALLVATAGGFSDVIVPRNAKIPCERTRAFTTSSDMQTGVRVRVAQGEDAFFDNNTFLGELELVGLRAGPRGEVTIQVRFEVDEGGTLKVLATDVATGKQAQALLQLVGIAGAKGVAMMQARQAGIQVR